MPPASLKTFSIHALLAESDSAPLADGAQARATFLSTLSLRRATNWPKQSIHHKSFLSTLSLRRATVSARDIPKEQKHFYPRSPCGERRWLRCWQLAARDISIHALLAESDAEIAKTSNADTKFLSTLSLRRATMIPLSLLIFVFYFYPRSPCGERLHRTVNIQRPTTFLSTLSLRRATIRKCQIIPIIQNFYPRSPCGERQYHQILLQHSANYFYPRSPCGERQSSGTGIGEQIEFLSTLSLRRATLNQIPPRGFHYRFLSTLSLRRATPVSAGLQLIPLISIHALLAESDFNRNITNGKR